MILVFKPMDSSGIIDLDFERIEFECECGCGFAPMDIKVLEGVQAVRDWADNKVVITSGCRCFGVSARLYVDRYPNEPWTLILERIKRSYHPKGMAADFKVFGKTPEQV